MVALITGASSGIGAATARRLAREPGTKLVLVARREDELRKLADEIGGATVVAVDLTSEDAPARVAEAVEREHGRLDLLVNNAGAAWKGHFAETGFEGVARNTELNYLSVVRLTEALLPLLRRSQPSAIVNVASVAGRVSRATVGGYSASKAALASWSDALYMEEARHGVHVGLVLPGFIETPGFPQPELQKRIFTRWLVSTPERAAEAIYDAGPGRKAERYVPRFWFVPVTVRLLMPALIRRGAHRGA